MPENNIGERIKVCREASGHTQAWLARELGINRSTVSRYEKGVTEKITLSTLEKIAELLGTTREYLYYGQGPMLLTDPSQETKNDEQSYLHAAAPFYESSRRESELTGETLAQACRSGRFTLIVETEELTPRIAPGDRLTVVVSGEIRNKYLNLFLEDGKLKLRRVISDGNIVTFMPNNGSLYSEIYTLDELQTKMKIVGYVERLESNRP